MSPRYRAETKVLVGPINGDIDTLRAASQITDSDVDIAMSRPLREQTRVALRLRHLPASAIVVTSNDLTRVLTIRAESDDPATATAIANTLATQLRKHVPAHADPAGRLSVIDPATPPTAPFAPRPRLLTALGAFGGLILGSLLVFLLEYAGDRVRDERDLIDLAAAPFLGRVDGIGGTRLRRRRLRFETGANSRAARRYLLLATKIALSNGDEPIRNLLVIGSEAGDGSGRFAANLAAAMATSGRHVVVIDADMENGEVTRLLRLERSRGLAELMDAGLADIDALLASDFCVQPAPRLHVIPRGRVATDDPGRHDVEEFLARLEAEADAVVVSAAPPLGSPATLAWAHASDAAVLLVARDQTRRASVSTACENLQLAGTRLVGTVLGVRSAGAIR
jgi:tyrosine-protein kinase Etk/Wzc